MMSDHSSAVVRVRKFLDVCGTPGAPIATAHRYSDEGRVILGSSVHLFAADVRALLAAVEAADKMLGLDKETRET